MTVRNEVDVLALNVAYHRSQGVEDFWIVDNGSTDGTAELLQMMADADHRIRWTSEPGAFEQSEFVTDLARHAHRAGATWIVPIDADEFWWTPHTLLVDVLRDSEAGALSCQLQTFVQASGITHDDPAGLLSMVYRSPTRGAADEARCLVETGQIAFVEMVYPPKLILRASKTLTIGMGNHGAAGYDGPMEQSTGFVVLHAALRSRNQLAKMAESGRRIAATNPDPGTSWHARRWAAMEADGRLAEDWPANSYRRGRLTIAGERRRCIRDDRIRTAVAPFVERANHWPRLLKSAGSRFNRHLAE